MRRDGERSGRSPVAGDSGKPAEMDGPARSAIPNESGSSSGRQDRFPNSPPRIQPPDDGMDQVSDPAQHDDRSGESDDDIPALLLGNEPDGIRERDNGGAQQCERGDQQSVAVRRRKAERAEKRKIISQ